MLREKIVHFQLSWGKFLKIAVLKRLVEIAVFKVWVKIAVLLHLG